MNETKFSEVTLTLETDKRQIEEIFNLQNKTIELQSQIQECLLQADKLTKELINKHKLSRNVGFVFENKLHILKHEAVGFGLSGNRDCLKIDDRAISIYSQPQITREESQQRLSV